MSPGRWIRPIAVLLGTAALVAAAAGPVRAAYQATADSNTTAFSFSCINVQVSPNGDLGQERRGAI